MDRRRGTALGDRTRPMMTLLTLTALVLTASMAPIASGVDEWEPSTTITWRVEDGPVVIDSPIEIAEDTRLVIEAGVQVLLDNGAGIQVKGHLDVRGTSEAPVLFTTNGTGPVAPDSWESVRLVSESAGRIHLIDHTTFEGARTGLQVSSTSALVQDCTFTNNRYGLVARGGADVDVQGCDFINNSALGLEWEQGSTGSAVMCNFTDNVVGAYLFEAPTPVVYNCEFTGNYHHVSFAGGSNGTVKSCTFRDAVAEAFECYDASSPLLDTVTIEGQDGDGIHIRNASRPRMVDGTPVSNLVVDSKDNASYVIAMARITVEVRGDDGKRLADANVTVAGASGMVFTLGHTDDKGRLPAMMSMYTVNSAGGSDLENPHRVTVEWRGHVGTFVVDPRDLDNDRVLALELDTNPPEPGGWDLPLLALVVLVIVVVAVAASAGYLQRRR